MKIDKNYKVRNVAGENIVVNFGKLNVNTTKIIALNDVALWLWNEFSGRDFTELGVAQSLVQQYGITPQEAATDGAKWIDGLKKAALLNE